MTNKSKTAEQTLRQAVEESISVAVERGVLDAKANAAPIALLRRMADTLDGNHDPLTLRYCTPASFTALFEKLGLMPTERQLEKRTPKSTSFQSRWGTLAESYKRSNIDIASGE